MVAKPLFFVRINFRKIYLTLVTVAGATAAAFIGNRTINDPAYIKYSRSK